MILAIQSMTFVGTLGLSLILLPRIGIDGVGWAWLATQTALAGWLVGHSLRPMLFARPGGREH
jgi:hypothetical protein